MIQIAGMDIGLWSYTGGIGVSIPDSIRTYPRTSGRHALSHSLPAYRLVWVEYLLVISGRHTRETQVLEVITP